MVVNAFSILNQDMNSIGTGIYLGVSVTDHSCKPNAVATFDGTTLYIRTIDNLPSVDWSKVGLQLLVLYWILVILYKFILVDIYFLCGPYGSDRGASSSIEGKLLLFMRMRQMSRYIQI